VSDTPPGGPGWLEQLNLPSILLGPAGKAFSRLLGELADIPSAGIQRLTQAIKSKTEAKAKVANALAEAVAKQVASNPELVKLAAQSFLAKELRGQDNKTEVAKKTLAILSEDESETVTQAPGEIDDDWLNVFERYAESASSERLQDLWARVLAGEIRKPKSYSLKTLRFISELDEEIARTFEKYIPNTTEGKFFALPKVVPGYELVDLLALEEYGLLSGATGGLSSTFVFDGPGKTLTCGPHVLFVNGTEGKSVAFPGCPLSRVGIELVRMLKPKFDDTLLRRIATRLSEEKHVSKISLGHFINRVGGSATFVTSEVLFERPTE
jgi:hypothetical protein